MVDQKSYQCAILHLDSQEGDHSKVVEHASDISGAEQLLQLLALSLLVKSVKHHTHVHALNMMLGAMYDIWLHNTSTISVLVKRTTANTYYNDNDKNASDNDNAVDDRILK